MCMLLQILLPLRTRRDRHRRLCPLGGFGSQRKKLTLRRCLIGGIAPAMDREESIDRRALTADARSVHHLHGLIHSELSLLAHHTSYKDDVDWPARQGCVVQASGVMRASGVWGGDAQATARERARLFVSSKHSTTRQPGVRVARPSARATGVWRHATGKDQHGRIRKPGRTLQGEAVVNECVIYVYIYMCNYIYIIQSGTDGHRPQLDVRALRGGRHRRLVMHVTACTETGSRAKARVASGPVCFLSK